MKLFPRRFWIGALLLIVISSSCNLPAQTPGTPQATGLPSEQSPTPILPASVVPEVIPTVLIPVTGSDAVSLQCQFCVNDETHALFIMPERASFLVSNPVIGINCLTAKVINGQRIVLCRGAQQTIFTLNVCMDTTNCIQFPVTLQPCPINPQTGAGNLAVTSIPFTQNAPAPVATEIPPTGPANPSVPAPTLTIIPSPVVTVASAPPFIQPTRGTHPLPSTAQPGTAHPDAAEFVRWYFAAVWQIRNYQDLWDNYLTLSFKNRSNSGGITGYVQWWSSVERVDVSSVDVIQNDGTHAWVRVTVTFTMKDGRVISNQQYDYALLFDATRQTWMFDFPS